jgi:hypothetical protein
MNEWSRCDAAPRPSGKMGFMHAFAYVYALKVIFAIRLTPAITSNTFVRAHFFPAVLVRAVYLLHWGNV